MSGVTCRIPTRRICELCGWRSVVEGDGLSDEASRSHAEHLMAVHYDPALPADLQPWSGHWLTREIAR